MPNLQTRMLSKIDTLENWTSNNPILLNKEFGYIVNQDTKQIQLKIGDGITNFNNLPIYEFASQPKQWILVGEGSGSNRITFDNNYDELYVEIQYYGTSTYFYFPKTVLSDSDKYWLNGWYASSSINGYVYIIATNTSIRLYEGIINGNDVIDILKVKVYAR